MLVTLKNWPGDDDDDDDNDDGDADEDDGDGDDDNDDDGDADDDDGDDDDDADADDGVTLFQNAFWKVYSGTFRSVKHSVHFWCNQTHFV